MTEKNFNLLRWLPVAGAVMLVGLIAVISMATIRELNDTTDLRKRTFDVILDAQSEEDDLIHAQSHIYHYAAEGSPNLLIQYKNDTNSELREFGKLADLTRDDLAQQQRLKDLNAAVQAVFKHDNQVIGLFARQETDTARKLEGESADELDVAVKDLEKFKDEEKRLLEGREAAEQKDYHRATHLLVLGGVATALLLVLANYFAGREMARRRQAESKQRELIQSLQKALAEVKTLSGLIPICGWCKSVRNDTGFWQSVEQYVRSRTDATFTHGMCPACTEKFKADIAKANEGKLPEK